MAHLAVLLEDGLTLGNGLLTGLDGVLLLSKPPRGKSQ